LDLRTPARRKGEVVKRRVVGVVGWRVHCWRRREVRGVVSGVAVRDRSSRRCIGVYGGMVGVYMACVLQK
jgi:hypothetical protein